MNSAPIFTTGTTLTSTGTAVTALIPLDGAGAAPRYIRVTATASGYFRVGKDTTAAVAGDMMVQPGDAVHLAVPGCLWFSFMSVSGSARVTVSPLEHGSWDKLTNQWSLNLDFTRDALDPRITFTRASSATFTNSAGLVASAATNVPRLDYNPVTLQPKGLLIEEARTNLLTYSEQFDNAAWGPTLGTTVTPNTTIAPDGTLTADTINFTTTANNRLDASSSTTAVAGTSYTFSVWLKGSGTINISSTEASGSPAGEITVTLTSVWTRYTVTYTAIASGATLRVMIIWRSTNTATSCQAWGAQLEAGAFATSYIPTVAAQVTRAADNAVMTGANFSSWYNQTEGTVFEEADVIYTGNFLTYPTYFIISDNSTSLLQVYGGLASTQITPNMQVAGVNQLDYVALNRTSGFDKLAVAYQANNTQFAMNAVTTTTDTVCSIPTVNRLDLGGRNTAYLNGHIKRFTYWPRRLSNAELQAVTR